MVVNHQMRVLAWSDALASVTGVSADEALGRRCWEVLAAVDGNDRAVCGEHCSIAHLALRDMAVPTVDVSLARAAAPRITFSTYTSRARTGAVLVHVLTPHGQRVPEADGVGLTPRQREALALLASGHSTTGIAQALGVSTVTARNHVGACLRKLDCHSRIEAVATARRLGLVS